MNRQQLQDKYKKVRQFSLKMVEPLHPEDMVIQAVEEASPVKWNLAHTSWFFETFILLPNKPGYRVFDERFPYLYNSYYVSLGERHQRDKRGLVSRPYFNEVVAYRHFIDEQMEKFLSSCEEKTLATLSPLIELGINHEQQHQELFFTDLKWNLSFNPFYPAYIEKDWGKSLYKTPLPKWTEFEGGIHRIGYEGKKFHFDNEGPEHEILLQDFRLRNTLVTNGEYLEFLESGGYKNPMLWLSDGFAAKELNSWKGPKYWEKIEGEWYHFTLNGMKKLNPAAPVCHISFYEADAFATWAGKRLPTEFEWEIAMKGLEADPSTFNMLESNNIHPVATKEDGESLVQYFGDVWEWTGSAYLPYPGYKPAEGAVGEYNGKFMSGQMVLKGGSCVTPVDHIRATYRNFFHPDTRWQFSGIRLAEHK